MRPGRAGRGAARSRVACTAVLGDLVGIFVGMADAMSGLGGLMGNWVGARLRVLRRAVDNAMGCHARRLGCACVPNVER